jgi:hypothetical protein
MRVLLKPAHSPDGSQSVALCWSEGRTEKDRAIRQKQEIRSKSGRKSCEALIRPLKKKAVVAIGRQLIVDLWRLQTGRVTAQELNLVMIGA